MLLALVAADLGTTEQPPNDRECRYLGRTGKWPLTPDTRHRLLWPLQVDEGVCSVCRSCETPNGCPAHKVTSIIMQLLLIVTGTEIANFGETRLLSRSFPYRVRWWNSTSVTYFLTTCVAETRHQSRSSIPRVLSEFRYDTFFSPFF